LNWRSQFFQIMRCLPSKPKKRLTSQRFDNVDFAKSFQY
jgi:hypothetical protein